MLVGILFSNENKLLHVMALIDLENIILDSQRQEESSVEGVRGWWGVGKGGWSSWRYSLFGLMKQFGGGWW